jgi:hypothetical protein
VAALLFVAEVSGNDPHLPGGGASAKQDRLDLRQLVRGAGDQDQPGAGVRQPERTARPMPRPAPVISAVLPAKSFAIMVSFVRETKARVITGRVRADVSVAP